MSQAGRQGLLRANVSVGLGTALSRATGLLRWVVLAYALGQASLSDAYNLANNSPNAVYELILGGVLSATLVPVFTAQLEDKDDERPTQCSRCRPSCSPSSLRSRCSPHP